MRGLCLALALSLGAPGPASREITVFAAASLTDAFLEMAPLLERGADGVRVRYNFAGSQQLALQLVQGARADVFAPADQRWMEHVEERGLTAGPSRIFAHNRLVVILPRSNPAVIHGLQDLGRRGVKLVVGAEAVPVGRYTREVLRRLSNHPGLSAGYGAMVLANVVSEEENVKSVVAKVQLGEADAGIVYRSDVTARVAPAVSVLEFPGEASVVAGYPITVLAGIRDPSAARAFVDLILSLEGRQVLARHGLLPAGATP